MSEGDITHARAPVGVHIASLTQGDGPIDILEIGGFGVLFPLDASEDQPRWRRFEERIRRFARLTKFDLGGIGYSDQFRTATNVDDWVSDAIAVLDAAQIERAVVFASSHGGYAAVELAARYPDRVTSLILANPNACASRYVVEKLLSKDRLRWNELEKWRGAVEPDSPAGTRATSTCSRQVAPATPTCGAGGLVPPAVVPVRP